MRIESLVRVRAAAYGFRRERERRSSIGEGEMRRLIALALGFAVACTGTRGVDGGAGGGGGGGTDAGPMDAGTTDAGPTDAGSADGGTGTLTGELSFNVVTITISAYPLDGGAEYSGLNVAWFDGPLPGSGCDAPLQGPLQTMRLQLSNLVGGALLPGSYTVGMGASAEVSGLRQDLDAQNQASVLGQLELGTVTITHLDTTSAGTFTGTLTHVDGGTSMLSGTWEGSVCRL